MRSLLLAPAALCTLALTASAQIQAPAKSPKASFTESIGSTEITVDYCRPAVRGRTIFGDLVPYDEVWRAGANAATAISFSSDVKLAGQDIAKGRYAFFVTPQAKGPWKVILNSVDEQWGSYNRDPEKDVLTFEVEPTSCAHQEYLRIAVDPTAMGKGEMSLAWDKTRIAFPISVDVHKVMTARITEAISKAGPEDWQVYYQAASYHYDNKLDLMQAMTWVNKSVEIEQQPQNLVLLANLRHETGDTAEAIPPMKRAIELAKPLGERAANYIKRLESTIKEWEASM